jgi:hypothetical protein
MFSLHHQETGAELSEKDRSHFSSLFTPKAQPSLRWKIPFAPANTLLPLTFAYLEALSSAKCKPAKK